MKKFKEFLEVKKSFKLKKVSKGYYSAKVDNIEIDVYKADGGNYWSSTIVIGKYGDDDFQEESIQGNSKTEVVKYIKNFIKKHIVQ